jgi:hypothetical protein
MRKRITVKGVLIGLLVTGVGVFFLISLSALPANNDNPVKVAAPKAEEGVQKTPARKIDYEVLRSWSIPNGGFGQEILISKKNVNLEDMTALGNQLKEEHKNDRNNNIEIYTDKNAPALQTAYGTYTLGDAEVKFYEDSYAGTYMKNANTGNHQFIIFLQGLGGKMTTIDY